MRERAEQTGRRQAEVDARLSLQQRLCVGADPWESYDLPAEALGAARAFNRLVVWEAEADGFARVYFLTGSALGLADGDRRPLIGTRAGLVCGATTGDLAWSQSYNASFNGSLNPANGALSLSGALSGSDGSSWRYCRTNGGPTACPAWGAGPYSFPVRLTGTVDRASQAGRGTLMVSNINLPTSDDWSSN